MLPKGARLVAFFEVLKNAPSAATEEEALHQLTQLLNAVEDLLTAVPYDPDAWQTDGRMYPPRADARHEDPDRPAVARYRSVAHNTFIGRNGAIEIRFLTGEIILSKPGADGREVSEL